MARVPVVDTAAQATKAGIQNASYTYDEDAEANDSYAIALDPALTAYAAGQEFTFKANTANTGAASLNVNSLGAVTLKKNHDQDLADNDIEAGSIVKVVYDGTNFQIISILAASAGLSNVVEDTTPQLGGDLDAQENDITDLQSLQFHTTPASVPTAEGSVYWDETFKTLAMKVDESDVTLQIGRESWIRVYNNSGSTITNGQAVTVSGYNAGADLPEIELCTTDDPEQVRFAGLATHDIENGTVGYITNFGRVNGLNTSSFTAGSTLYLDPTTAGALTETRPDAPAYVMPVGVVVRSHASLGSIFIGATSIHGGNARLSEAFWNGAIVESVDVDVTSNGTVITLSLQQDGGGDLTLLMGETRQTLDCTPAATVTLTAGSDTAPQINYIYVPASTDTLTASTSGFPSEQHVPIATVLCQSAASLQNDGAYKVHVWNDHLSDSDDQGHLSHLNAWIRYQNATWLSGVAVTPTAGASTLDVATSAGVILQLHEHAYPAFDTSSGGEIYVVNDPDTAYTKVGDLTIAGGVDKDANGTTLGDAATDFYNLVLWGVVSENASECKLMCNLPDGAYANNNGSQAENDANNTAVYTIPNEYKGTGFLIARLTIQESGGTYTVVKNTDLRGQFPGLQSGQGAFGGNEFADNVFRIQDNGDATKEVAFEVSGVTTATTRTITVPDKNLTLIDEDDITRVVSIQVLAFDGDTATGDGQAFFRIPSILNGWDLTDVEAAVYTAGTTGTLDIQIRNKTQAADMLSTKMTIDSGETDTSTAATAPVIDTANDDVATGDIIAVDIDAIHSGTAAQGLTVELTFTKPA